MGKAGFRSLPRIKWQMILIIALMILGACFDMVQPLSGFAVDNFIEPRTTEGLIPFTTVYLSMVVVQTITTILMAIYALKGLEMYFRPRLKAQAFRTICRRSTFPTTTQRPSAPLWRAFNERYRQDRHGLAWSLVDIFWAPCTCSAALSSCCSSTGNSHSSSSRLSRSSPSSRGRVPEENF